MTKIRKKARTTRITPIQALKLRDTAPAWLEIAGEAVLSRGPTLRIPVRFGMTSVDSMMPSLIEVAADGEVLERAFVNDAFAGRMVKLELGDLNCRTSVKGHKPDTGALWLDAAPFLRAMVRLLAAQSRPPFMSFFERAPRARNDK